MYSRKANKEEYVRMSRLSEKIENLPIRKNKLLCIIKCCLRKLAWHICAASSDHTGENIFSVCLRAVD